MIESIHFILHEDEMNNMHVLNIHFFKNLDKNIHSIRHEFVE